MVISLQNSLKFSDHEQRAYETKERDDVRKKLEIKAAELFKLTFDYNRIKNKYMNAIRDGNLSKSQIRNIKNKVENILYKRISKKKKFKAFVQ
jgi:hypothetical protein